MVTLHVFALLALAAMTSCQTDSCKPGDNCKPPDCRCWNDQKTPGGFKTADTPQVVLVTFEYAVNSGNADQYTSLFDGLTNPNECPAVGTFYVQKTNTDLGVVKTLYDNGHEIGVTSVDGTTPKDLDGWKEALSEVKKAVSGAGVSEDEVLGVRAPELAPKGLDQFTAMAENGFLYDTSCSTSRFDDQSSLIWPYTYDYAPGPACDNGESPEQEFPGKWQVLIADLEFNGTKCATPSACTAVATARDAFDMLYNSFLEHYEGNRSPFLIVINPQWVTVDFKREGTREFIEYVRSAFEDTWVLGVRQALEWVRNPVPSANATADYPPWGCK